MIVSSTVRSRIGMFLAVVAVAALAGCANRNVKQPLPKGMKGNINITAVKVSLAPGVKSTQIQRMLSEAIKKEAAEKKLTKGQAVEMEVLLTLYRGPENRKGGVAMTRVFGGTFQMNGTIKIVNPSNKAVLAVYDAFGRYKRSGLSLDLSHTPHERLIDKFMYWAMEPIA